ncbi:vitrin isoform X8 [Cyprinodon tularosa]|uniref:vitrin isoform X8 n=1 Tax=Cyprinodon tularosa TaxID=77115 RepID=UPI0018E28732|nr:vitrin isoform X8 [Cyprinodon tularosa]
MIRSITVIFCAFLLSWACWAKPNGSKSKKPKQVVPDIECDIRAGKVTVPEFIARCPARCKETKQQVYGTGIYASISSICNAAIHSGIITNAGGKVIVRKMAGQNVYKGSNSNGVRSLSLPKWRESFVVSVGKPKKGVIYPSTLDYATSRPTYVKTGQKDAKSTTLPPTTTASEVIATTPEPTTTTTTAPTTTTTTTTPPPPPTTTKARAAVHKVRDAGVHRPEAGSVIRRQPSSPARPAFPRRDWPPSSYGRPDWFPGARRPAAPTVADASMFSAVHSDVSYAVPDSGYAWSETDTPEIPARDLRPDISEYERWLYSFGPYPPRSSDLDGSHKMPLDLPQAKVEPPNAWRPGATPYESGFSMREQEPPPRAPELPASQGDPNCKVDLAFLMDGSWSIGKRRFKIQKDFLAEVAQVINVGMAGPMMGIIQYGDEPVTEFSLRTYSSSRDVKAAVDKIVQKGGLSNVGKALSYINKQYFSDANGNRGGAPNVAVVLVDGWPTDKVEEASRLARESGINIFFVTIEGADENEKQNLVEANFVEKAVCRTNGFFSLPVNSWFALRKAVQPLVKRVCDTDRLVCSKTCLNANDIAFVIDGSSSVGTGNFRTVLQFVANVTREFEISDTDTRVGAVQYTYEQRLEFAFGQYNNKAELLNAIKRINYWSGGTSTGAAITFAADQLFSKSKPNKRKIMIVITDGRSYDDVRAPALAVHRQGVIAYSIGIAWAAQDELEYIATDPDKEHSFFVDEFDNLYKYVSKIIHNICQEFNSQPRN